MNFDDHDWELGQPPTEAVRDASILWKVAAGVAIGMVLGGMLVYAVDRQRVPAADAGAGTAIDRLLRGAEAPAAGNPIRPAEPAPAPPTTPAQATPERSAEPVAAAALTDSPPDAEAAQRAARRAAERKDRAWAAFYRKPAYCDENPTKASMVECANHYIRARREFEEAYGNGKR